MYTSTLTLDNVELKSTGTVAVTGTYGAAILNSGSIESSTTNAVSIYLEEHRKISQEDAKKFKDDFMLNLYMETSAKTGFNAKEIFIEAARVLFKEYNKYKKIDEEKKIKLPKLSEQDPNTVIEKKNCNC